VVLARSGLVERSAKLAALLIYIAFLVLAERVNGLRWFLTVAIGGPIVTLAILRVERWVAARRRARRR